jgi:hypothetical protein
MLVFFRRSALLRASAPPAWIAQLRDEARSAEKSISYDVKIYSDLSWRRKRFTFDEALWNPNNMTSILRKRLCLGDEHTEYTVIGEAFPFPDREDSPVVNEPQAVCRLYWDHNSSTEKIMIQLSDCFPPILWITVKPTFAALKKIFSEFIDIDAQHMKKYLPYYESVQNALETEAQEKLGETLSNSRVKDRFIEDMRKRDPRSLELDYTEEFTLFLGTVPHFRNFEDRMMKSNPFLFGWPLLVGDGNHHLEGTPLRMCAFRSIYSKSMVMFFSRIDLQVDHRLSHLEAKDEPEVVLDVPIFASLNFPRNGRLCGGESLVARYNKVMGTSYPLQTPVDLLAALAAEATQKSAVELMQELTFLQRASEKAPDAERVVRVSPDMLSSNRIIGQLAFTVLYLALVGYERFVDDVFNKYSAHASDIVRVACAKGAQLVGRPELVQQLADHEPEGRVRQLMLAALDMTVQDNKVADPQTAPEL